MKPLLTLLAATTLALAADPVIGTVTLAPTFAPANTPTQVTITALITDPTLSLNGANVQRLNTAGSPTAVLGILHDDGLNGDLTANDGIFTLVFTLNEPTSRVTLRTSASFQGVAARVASSTVAIDIGTTTTTPLTIDATLSSAPNAAGWFKQDISVTFACTGGAGGLQSCPGIMRVTTEGNAQPISFRNRAPPPLILAGYRTAPAGATRTALRPAVARSASPAAPSIKTMPPASPQSSFSPNNVQPMATAITGEINAKVPGRLAPQSRTSRKYIVVDISAPGTSR